MKINLQNILVTFLPITISKQHKSEKILFEFCKIVMLRLIFRNTGRHISSRHIPSNPLPINLSCAYKSFPIIEPEKKTYSLCLIIGLVIKPSREKCHDSKKEKQQNA